MTIDSTDNDNGNSFEYRLKEVSDEEIINILRYREHFQPHAVHEAIKEAMRRGIISSLDDLEKEEFKAQPLPPKSLFPISATESQNVALFKSLCRIIYGFSIIPIVYGVLQLSEHNFIKAVSAIIIGLVIIFITFKLERSKKILLAQLLLLINVPSTAYAIYYLLSLGRPKPMDIFAVIIIVVVILYATIYINKLINYFIKNSKG